METKQVKIKDVQGKALDYLVAKCEGKVGNDPAMWGLIPGMWGAMKYQPTKLWAQGGPIIEREKIDLLGMVYGPNGGWTASTPKARMVGWRHIATGQTPLIAAMRCYVASKLGDVVEVPESLI